MALADVSDVVRVLNLSEPTPEQKAKIEHAIQTAEDWAKRYLKWPTLGEVAEEEGEYVTETFYDISPGGFLPAYGRAIHSVKVYDYSDSSARTLESKDWYPIAGGINLRPFGTAYWDTEWAVTRDPRYAPGHPSSYFRVDIEYEKSELSPVIRDGVAIAAASIYTRSERLGRGIKSESLGDYSYQLAGDGKAGGDPWYEEARSFLRPLRRRGSLVP